MISQLLIIFCTTILISYLLYKKIYKKKLHLLYEISLLKIYILIILLSLFPQILEFIEVQIGIVNIVLTFAIIWILILFIIVFELYKIIEFQRQEMTKLVREVAFLKFEIKSGNKIDSNNSTNRDKKNKK
ncbi:MAG: DUF2304 family protein [Candidatus Woesearchaeota archaeon]